MTTTQFRLAPRIAAVGASPTLAVDSKAKAMRARGEDVIGFGAGEPDFPTPEHIIDAARQACGMARMHKYGPTAGLPELRSAIAEKTARDSGYAVGPDQVLVTNGGKQALYNAMTALLDAGDELLLPSPYWNTYEETARLAGASVVVVPGAADQGFRVTVEQLERARTPRTKVLAFVSPSNPTGAVYSREEIVAIGEWAVEHDLWVVTDEIYEHLVYDGVTFHSLPVEVPGLAERTIVINGVAKTFAMTGWRVGWAIGPTAVIGAIERFQSHTTSHVCHVAQAAALAAMQGGLDDVHRMREVFAKRRGVIHAAMNQIPHVECQLPDGAFYAFPSFEHLLGRELYGVTLSSTIQLSEIVLERGKVAFVPGEAFGAIGFARFSYALAEEAMVEGVDRLRHVVEDGLTA